MKLISFGRHRFPAEVIRHAVWLYFRFSLGFRDVQELLAQRGIEVSYETIRCWTIKFGPLIGGRLFDLARLTCQRAQSPLARWAIEAGSAQIFPPTHRPMEGVTSVTPISA